MEQAPHREVVSLRSETDSGAQPNSQIDCVEAQFVAVERLYKLVSCTGGWEVGVCCGDDGAASRNGEWGLLTWNLVSKLNSSLLRSFEGVIAEGGFCSIMFASSVSAESLKTGDKLAVHSTHWPVQENRRSEEPRKRGEGVRATGSRELCTLAWTPTEVERFSFESSCSDFSTLDGCWIRCSSIYFVLDTSEVGGQSYVLPSWCCIMS